MVWVSLTVLAGALWGGATAGPARASGSELVGTFTITAGSCAGGSVTGSYFRMIAPGGTPDGPYMSNNGSACSNQQYTPMSPGSDGGFESGRYQPQPSPEFDSSGNSLASRIITPASFYGVNYGVSTNPVDPQTGIKVPPPNVTSEGNSLSADLRAFSVSWNRQQFNQGTPKPDGTSPGNTRPATGTYDPRSGAYTLRWTSQIIGGPFNGFAGLWNLEGRFIPAGHSTASAPTGPASNGATAGSSTGQALGTGPASGSGSGSGMTQTPTAGSGAASALSSPRVPSSVATATTPTSAVASAPAARGRSASPAPNGRGGGSGRWLLKLAAAAGLVVLASLLGLELSRRRRSLSRVG